MANVLVDLDNTLTKVEPVLQKMADVFGKKVKSPEELTSYNLGDLYGLTPEQDRMFWNNYGYQVIEDSEPNIKMFEKLYFELMSPDDNVYIITARPESQRRITEEWVFKMGIYQKDKVILTGKNPKTPLIEQLQIDTIFDDNPDLFEKLEVEKELFPNSHIAKTINSGKMKRYVIDYNYNKDVVSEFRINRETGEVTNGNEA